MVTPAGTYSNHFLTPPAGGFDSLECSVCVNVSDLNPDPTPRVGWYYACQFLLGDDGGYIGIQTKGGGFHRNPPVAIFAMFSTLVGGDVRGPGYASTHTEFSGGHTTMIPYPWKLGIQNRLRVERTVGDTGAEQWWGAWVDDRLIGEIRVPDAWEGIDYWAVQWTERYSAEPATCAEMTPSEVIWTPPLRNGSLPDLAASTYDVNNEGTGKCLTSTNEHLGNGVSRQRCGWTDKEHIPS